MPTAMAVRHAVDKKLGKAAVQGRQPKAVAMHYLLCHDACRMQARAAP